MSVAASLQLPDTGHLEQVLGRLGEAGTVIVQRSRNVYTSSYPSEVLTCEAGDGDVRRLLCKYGPTGTSTGHGHRGGVAYEGAVYRHVLEAVGMDTPRLWGVHDERAEGLARDRVPRRRGAGGVASAGNGAGRDLDRALPRDDGGSRAGARAWLPESLRRRLLRGLGGAGRPARQHGVEAALPLVAPPVRGLRRVRPAVARSSGDGHPRRVLPQEPSLR